MSGRANKKIPKGLENGKIFVGSQKAPVAVIKRCEVQDYLTEDFSSYYGCWSRFHNGLGLPFGDGWAKYPDSFVTIMELLNSEWEKLNYGKDS